MNMQDLPKERHLKFAQKYTHQHPNLNEDLVQHKLNVPMQKEASSPPKKANIQEYPVIAMLVMEHRRC